MPNPNRRRSYQAESLEPRRVLSSAGVPHPAAIAGAIVGSVTADWTNAPVAGVRIQVVNAAGRVVGQTRTDASGQFLFDGVPAGAYIVRESGQRGAVTGLFSLNGGLLVGVGDIDLKTGAPEPGGSVEYVAGKDALNASSPGLDDGEEPTKAEVSAVLRQEATLYLKPFKFSDDGPLIDTIARGGVLGAGGIATLL